MEGRGNDFKMKIILYGIGSGTEYVENQLKKDIEIAGYSDSFSNISVYNAKPFVKRNELINAEFDYLIITATNPKTARKIKQSLISETGIKDEKIIPYFVYAPRDLITILAKNNDFTASAPDGVILGNSHARDAYLPSLLGGNAINLAVSSQDIAYNIEVFWKFVKICGKMPQWVIFDLYDYNVFNIDISLSRELFNYINNNGSVSGHSFSENTQYLGSFEEELANNTGYGLFEGKIKDIFNTLFDNPVGILSSDNMEVNSMWTGISPDEPLETQKFFASIVTKRFDETIKRNIELLGKFVTDVHETSKETVIHFTLIPRLVSMERALEPFMKEWKKGFDSVISDIVSNKNVYFHNYKGAREISENNRYYYNVNHLNTIGASCFSSMVYSDIF